MEVRQWYGKKERRSRIRSEQINNLRGLLGIRRMNKVLNARIKVLCGMTKGVYEKIDKGVIWWFDDVKRMENYRIAKRMYVVEWAGSHLVGWPWKRLIGNMKDLKKKKKVWMSGKQGEWCI